MADKTRELKDFVDAALAKGGFPKNPTLLRIYIRKLVWKMKIYGEDNIHRLADDVIEELEYSGDVPKQPKRKTKRYFPKPIRLETPRDKYIFDLAKTCIEAYGKDISFRIKIGARQKSSKWSRGGEQEDFASDFLAKRRKEGKLQHNVQQAEFLSMIRRINAQKATPSKRRKEAREKKATKVKPINTQQKLF